TILYAGHLVLVPLNAAPHQVLRLDQQMWSAVQAYVPHFFPADRGATGEDMLELKDHNRQEYVCAPRLRTHRNVAATRPAKDRRPRLGQLIRDVLPGVRGADHQHRTRPQLCRPLVLTRVQLPDVRSELICELGCVRRASEGAGGHHNVVARYLLLAEGREVSAPGSRLQPFDASAGPHRQVEMQGVALQVIADLVLS